MLFILLTLAAQAVPKSCDHTDASAQDSQFCSEDNYKLAKASLEVAYRNARRRARIANPRPAGARADETLEKAVVLSQVKWAAFRDAQCAMEQFEGRAGSMAGSFELACLARLTAARTHVLDQFAGQIGK